ncbi:MAG TPA: pyrroloquinoline quinone precursor peptide PqqA [Thermodesulfobacteriota bacterium]
MDDRELTWETPEFEEVGASAEVTAYVADWTETE